MSIAHLNPTLEKAANKPQEKASWRKNTGNFREDEPGLMAAPGLVTMGIRQSQGHEVRHSCYMSFTALTLRYRFRMGRCILRAT